MDLKRVYDYRFQGISQEARERVWGPIANYIFNEMGKPAKVLDPAAGRGEFINAIPAEERWVVDRESYPERAQSGRIKVVLADVLEAELPFDYFDGIFISNFLEHLADQATVARFLKKMHACLKSQGRIAILGPNFKYCSKEYFDCADHCVALTEVSTAEHLYAAGFTVGRVVPKFLPYSFRSRLPQTPKLTQLYLNVPLVWRFLGKQFLVQATKR